jgi:DNA-binding MarR family transcriptional regulator
VCTAERDIPTATGDLSASGDALAHQKRCVSLDRFLELIHREDLSPVDLRVLMRVTDREASIRELANSMGQHPAVLRRASTRLVARGLLRRRQRPTADRRLEVTLAATATGTGALCRMTQSLREADTQLVDAQTIHAVDSELHSVDVDAVGRRGAAAEGVEGEREGGSFSCGM